MAYVITAKWKAQPGHEETVLAAIRSMIEPSRSEPGCLYYQPNRDPSDASIFFFYEQYVDADAYTAHSESDHFQRYALGQAIPLLESRERAAYETLD
jgi:quinol monooxygenase YgiN